MAPRRKRWLPAEDAEDLAGLPVLRRRHPDRLRPGRCPLCVDLGAPMPVPTPTATS